MSISAASSVVFAGGIMSTPVLAGTPGASASDRKITAEELDQARRFIGLTQNAVLGATKGLSEEQWRFKPAPDRWSIAEILEHIITVQERVLGPVLEQLGNGPAPPAGQDLKIVDSIVINQFPNRLTRFSAPQFVHPSGGIAPQILLERFEANCAGLARGLESTVGLREHVLDSPPLKAVTGGAFQVMDGYQWILAAAAHAERHTKQILEVIADAGYPA
jgi:hypothetical protein